MDTRPYDDRVTLNNKSVGHNNSSWEITLT
jgi:hypothetical protein